MNNDSYEFREEMLELQEKLLSAEASRLDGAKTYSIDEVSQRLKGIIDMYRGISK